MVTDTLIIICMTLVLLAAIAAWLISRVAHDAIAKAEPQDVPEVVDGMSRLLTGFRIFVPGDPRAALRDDLSTPSHEEGM